MNNEPVAWLGKDYDGFKTDLYFEVERNKLPYRLYESAIPLYTHPVKEESEQQNHQEVDGCPTELAVLQRFWRKNHPVKQTYRELHEGFSTVIEATHPVKELTDEEINVVSILQDAEIVPVGHEIWKTDEEFNKYKRIVLATAKALRKAQE